MASSGRQVVGYLFMLLLGLVIGWFGGREYLKYEMRSAFQTAAVELQRGLGIGPNAPTLAPPAASVPAPPAKPPAEPAPFELTLVNKGFKPKNIQAGDFQEGITIGLSIKNLTRKDVRAFDGVLEFTDLLDNEILSTKLAINDPVNADTSMTWQGMLDFNPFVDQQRRLRDSEEANLKVVFRAQKVLFTDGTTKQYSE